MNVFILTILLVSFLNNVTSITSTNYPVMLKNNYLRFILLSDKRNIKIFKEFKHFYNKSIICIGQGVSDYNNNLSEDEKTILEVILSLCY